MTASRRIWLDVPYADKDEAKALGAWWDDDARRWYAPHPGMTRLERWQALDNVLELLSGEDRSWGSGLYVDLVPTSCWFTNLRSCVTQRDWERLRRMITTRAGGRCEICHRAEDRQSRRWLEAHERWAYDHRATVQSLRRLICLCTDCHTATHYGLATVTGKDRHAFKHLCAVTGLTAREVSQQIDTAFTLWRVRSRSTWELDHSILTDSGIMVSPPPVAATRKNIGERSRSDRDGIVAATRRPASPRDPVAHDDHLCP